MHFLQLSPRDQKGDKIALRPPSTTKGEASTFQLFADEWNNDGGSV